MDLNKAVDALKFDRRMKDWMLKQGLVTPEDLEKKLKELPDSQTHCENLTFEDKGDFEN